MHAIVVKLINNINVIIMHIIIEREEKEDTRTCLELCGAMTLRHVPSHTTNSLKAITLEAESDITLT